jgi:hypothetical protein
MAYEPTLGYPSLAAIRAWVQVSAVVLDDVQLEHVAGAEQADQIAKCAVDAVELQDPLYQAFLRRVARHLAAKGVPLGILAADAEYGTVRLSKFDPEYGRLEAPYRIRAFA